MFRTTSRRSQALSFYDSAKPAYGARMVAVPVFLHIAMQQPLQALARGYVRHVGGSVEAERLLGFAAKFEALYATEASYAQRQNRRRRGLAAYRLFLQPRRGSTKFDWLLLATQGTYPEGADEKWRDATRNGQRLGYQGRFEAVQMPAKGGINRWTWRISPAVYASLASAVPAAIAAGDDAGDTAALRQLIRDLHRMPGFRGVRGQVTALRKLITTEWQRRHPGTSCPGLPLRVQGYQRYRTNTTVAAELVIERIRRGLPPIAFAWRRNAVASSSQSDTAAS